MTEQLKPCPFCGSPAEMYSDGDDEGHQVMCSSGVSSCHMNTFGHQTVDEAVAAWNTRSPQPAQAGEVGERVAFEKWATSLGYNTERDMFQRDMYQSTLTWELWRVWQARASLPTQPAAQATPEPVPAEQGKWCEYVAGMVDCWVSAEWSHYHHMDEGRRVKAIAGIIERRLWALQKQAAPEPLHLFEFWWESHMPQATQSQAWSAWTAAQNSKGATIDAAQATPEPLTPDQQSALKQALFKSARIVEQATPEPVQADSSEHLRVIASLGAALRRLSFAAQTSGGTAGPDAELQAAIRQAEQALSLGGIGQAMFATPPQQAAGEPVGEPLGYIPTDAIDQIKTPPRLITRNVPVLSYAADGYTAIYTHPAPGAPVGWRDAKNDPPPVGVDVLVAVEFDGPGDWRIKVGGRNPQERTGWCVFGASWVPQVWMPLDAHRAALAAAQAKPRT